MKWQLGLGLFSTVFLISLSSPAQSKWGSGIDFTEKAAKREKSRWSLTDWLAMKERNRMMDMWLSLNAPTPFEFMLGASYLNQDFESEPTTTKVSLTGYAAEFSAYAQFIGVSAEFAKLSPDDLQDFSGMLNIRILGNSVQNTSVTLHVGQRTRQILDQPQLTQTFGQVSLQLYLTKYFGLEGQYRHFLPSHQEDLEIDGNRSEVGIFLDLKALRLFGNWYEESLEQRPLDPTLKNTEKRTGIRSGIKLFF